jgi:hypothetical protein
MGRKVKRLQAVPSVKEGDIANLLWAWDKDGPLRMGTGNTLAAEVFYIWK